MSENTINYKFIFNKIFTGSYLQHNLGHELINFIKLKNNERYVYINPWGERSENAAKNTEYALHIMGVTYETEKYYELVAVSKIKKDFNTLYNKDLKKEKINAKKSNLIFEEHHLCEIFTDSKAHIYSFMAEKFYVPKKNTRIFFNVKSKDEEVSDKPEILYEDAKSKIFLINVTCNPQRNKCYSKEKDIKVLENLVELKDYLEENDENIVLNRDEQCFAVISDRTHLEDSTSNQISYFLNRDKNIFNGFIKLINKYLLNDKIEKNEKFEILREENHIDLLLKSEKHVIVIENKIDSNINGEKESNSKLKESQLSAYYQYVMKDKSFKNAKKENKHFFILEPEYSSITRKKLDENYKNGKEYHILHYNELYDVLKNVEYNPYGKQNDKEKEKRAFLYQEFLHGLKYISSSKAEQMKETAYIRLKQRINELDAK